MTVTINGTGSITGLTSGAGIAATALSGQVPDANAPSGSVIQVVNYTTTATVATSSSTYVTTGFSNSITPSSTSSKILVLVNCCLYNDASAGETQTQIYRNGSNVSGIVGDVFSSSGRIVGSGNSFYLDSPSTTSSTTYTIYFRQGTAGAGYIGVNSTTTSIILMEIAG